MPPGSSHGVCFYSDFKKISEQTLVEREGERPKGWMIKIEQISTNNLQKWEKFHWKRAIWMLELPLWRHLLRSKLNYVKAWNISIFHPNTAKPWGLQHPKTVATHFAHKKAEINMKEIIPSLVLYKLQTWEHNLDLMAFTSFLYINEGSCRKLPTRSRTEWVPHEQLTLKSHAPPVHRVLQSSLTRTSNPSK